MLSLEDSALGTALSATVSHPHDHSGNSIGDFTSYFIRGGVDYMNLVTIHQCNALVTFSYVRRLVVGHLRVVALLGRNTIFHIS
jgi:hypothetical protein